MMQFVPEDGLYVYFRYDSKHTVMVVMNTSKQKKRISIDRFKERTKAFSAMKNVQTGDLLPLADFSLPPNGSGVYELL